MLLSTCYFFCLCICTLLSEFYYLSILLRGYNCECDYYTKFILNWYSLIITTEATLKAHLYTLCLC